MKINGYSMYTDGIASAETPDSSGEILQIKGCDITEWEEGRGLLNWEHRNPKSPGAGPNDFVGKIVYCKKIFKRDDCENDRQKMYWDSVKVPYIYVVCRLYDGAGHPQATALAAQIRDHVANGDMIMCRYSLEGSTLDKKDNVIRESVARLLSFTIKPANRACDSGLLADPNAPKGFEMKPTKEAKDILSDLATHKSSNEIYQILGHSPEMAASPILTNDLDLVKSIKLLAKVKVIKKALEAGNYNVAPSMLTGGSAISKESLKNKALATFRDYHGRKYFSKTEFRAYLKHSLPEVDDSFLDYFSDLVDKTHIKKREQVHPILKMEALSVDLLKATAEIEPPTTVLDAEHHAFQDPLSNTQHAMFHGTDLSNSIPYPKTASKGMNEARTTWHKTANGQKAIVKQDFPDIDDDSSKNEEAYHNIAHSVFGLGHHVPPTVRFHHPITGIPSSIQQVVEGHLPLKNRKVAQVAVNKLNETGNLDKLGVMNRILGNNDRHKGNFLVSEKAPFIHLIDHGAAFSNGNQTATPGYWRIPQNGKEPDWGLEQKLHPKALKWISNLNPQKLQDELIAHGIHSQPALERLKQVQDIARLKGEHTTRANILGHNE